MPSENEIFIKYIRNKRHEILNDLQVILGYAQLGKLDKVIEYTHKTIANINKDKEIFNIDETEQIIKKISDNF
ncbi:MAG: Spo0B domain-containing protein [Thermoanaerobacteraceae bacterium]